MWRGGNVAQSVQLLAQTAVAAVGPADTNENTLATITIPANRLGTAGTIRVTCLFSCTSSANNKTFNVRYSGAAGTLYANLTFTTITSVRFEVEIQNQGVTNAQVGNVMYAASTVGVAGSAAMTSAVDTTAATTVVITGTKASAGETLRLERYSVEVLNA
jgi:hypothetical protein